MKRIAAISCLSLALLQSSNAAEPPNAQEQQLTAAIKEIQAQQALISENQAKIEAKLATVAEAVRIARIYSSRGGS
jgi:hemolysin activation/secretion protein